MNVVGVVAAATAAATLCRASVATTKNKIYYLPNEMQKANSRYLSAVGAKNKHLQISN